MDNYDRQGRGPAPALLVLNVLPYLVPLVAVYATVCYFAVRAFI